MGELTIAPNEKDLFSFFQRKRLEVAKSFNDMNLSKTESIAEEKPTFWSSLKNRGKNFIRKAQRDVHGYEKKKRLIDDGLSSFDGKYPSVIDRNTAHSWSSLLFADDKYGLAKLSFAAAIILDDKYQYEYEEEGLKAVSSILFDDEATILTIKEQLFANYKAIASTGLSATQKGVLFGVAVAATVGVFAMPILLAGGAGAAAPVTTAALAAHGFGDMQIGLGVLALESVAVGAVMTGMAYSGMKLYNEAQVKREFLNLTPEKHAMFLAIQCTHIQRIKPFLSEEDFKERLDTVLKNLNVLKSDLDYYLFVEKESTKQNKSKIKSFHEFDDRLMKVLGV